MKKESSHPLVPSQNAHHGRNSQDWPGLGQDFNPVMGGACRVYPSCAASQAVHWQEAGVGNRSQVWNPGTLAWT